MNFQSITAYTYNLRVSHIKVRYCPCKHMKGKVHVCTQVPKVHIIGAYPSFLSIN